MLCNPYGKDCQRRNPVCYLYGELCKLAIFSVNFTNCFVKVAISSVNISKLIATAKKASVIVSRRIAGRQ